MIKTNEIKQKDALLEEITDYVLNKEVTSAEAFSTARYVLLDTLGCGILALQYPECTKLLWNQLCQEQSCQMVHVYQVRLMY